MTAPESSPQRLRVAHLNPRSATPFALKPDAEMRARIAAELGLSALTKLSFQGSIRPEANDAWLLTGTIEAKVTQACVVTLRPVKTAIRDDVRRLFTPHLSQPDSDETQMPDDTLEPLGQFIDLSAVMIEALSLALPEYPRAEGAEIPGTDSHEPEVETRRPFSGLDDLLRGKDG